MDEEQLCSKAELATLSGSAHGLTVASPLATLFPPPTATFSLPFDQSNSRTHTSKRNGTRGQRPGDHSKNHQANEKDKNLYVQAYDEHIKIMNQKNRRKKSTLHNLQS